MNYKVVFETSTDKYSAKRLYVKVPAERLARKIKSLQDAGNVIFEVRQEHS